MNRNLSMALISVRVSNNAISTSYASGTASVRGVSFMVQGSHGGCFGKTARSLGLGSVGHLILGLNSVGSLTVGL